MSDALRLSQGQRQKQVQTLSIRQIEGLNLLLKSLPELRAEIVTAISENPVLEDIDHPLEQSLSELEREHGSKDAEPDYPEDDYEPSRGLDEEAAERRQNFFDSIPDSREESLQAHLIAQLPTSDIPESRRELAELLIGDLDDDGRYVGNVANLQMVCQCPAEEIEATRRQVMELDPLGCGARTAQECLLAQLAKIPISPLKPVVRRLIERHFEDMAANRLAAIERDLGITRGEYVEALTLLRTLDPHPGRQFPSEKDRVEYVNPEVHSKEVNGWWRPVTDQRSLPEIRIAQKYLALLADPQTSAEDRKYVAERIEAAKALQEAVAKRQGTLQRIADCIYDRQQDFFDEGPKALKPLTEVEVAEAVGVAGTTVSRAVRNKYAATPFGTVELRKFFVSGVQSADGGLVSQTAVLEALREAVAEEDPAHPLSDDKLVSVLAAKGYPIKRRTIAKYRDKLAIPTAAARRKKGLGK